MNDFAFNRRDYKYIVIIAGKTWFPAGLFIPVPLLFYGNNHTFL